MDLLAVLQKQREFLAAIEEAVLSAAAPTGRTMEDIYSLVKNADAALVAAIGRAGSVSEAAAALGRLGRGASKRRDVDYAALGAKGGAAGKGKKKPRRKKRGL